MDGNRLVKKGIVLGIVLLFLGSNFAAGSIKNTVHENQQICNLLTSTTKAAENISMTLLIYGKHESNTQAFMSAEDANRISDVFTELKNAITAYPFSQRTELLKQEFVSLLAEHKLIPAQIPSEQYDAILNPPWFEKLRGKHTIISLPFHKTPITGAGSAVALFCSLSGEGFGVLFPFIMLPRPRVIMGWSTLEGNSVVGKLLTIGGFVGSGAQFGFALGFWGIGLAYATPYGTLYGFIGYSLFASVTAQSLERYPPDYPPEIITTNPIDEAKDVPISLTELQFSIEDPSGDLMSYQVTTDPDIGSGGGSLKPSGTYSIPVQGIKSITQYSWTVKVSDDVQTTEQTFTFTSEAAAPIVSDESPADGDRYVPETQNMLSFHLRDPQNDLMSYTVETSPFIGSGSGSGVGEDDFSIPISGLQLMTEYRWFVNATDGKNQTSEEFWFRTEPLMVFDPFAEGWEYRKIITINHTMVAGDLQHFPVLLSFTDSDLRDKAQDDGDDILFMDGTGVATRLYHEIEEFDATTGRLVAWVDVSSLSSTFDTAFYLYYGYMDSSDQQCPEKVWDTDFVLVHHFDEKSGTLFDSTVYSNDGVPYGGVTQEAVGKIGNANSFDGSNDYIECKNSPSLNPSSTISLEVWFKPVAFSGEGNDPIIDKGYYQHSTPYYQYHLGVCGNLRPGGGGTFTFYVANDGFQSVNTPQDTWVPNNWYHVVGTYNGTTMRLYINGVLNDSKNVVSSITDFGKDLRISHYSNFHEYLPGTIDEMRISSISRSAAWILTEYHNQENPIIFSVIGLEEPHP